jgi:hypothetical protein
MSEQSNGVALTDRVIDFRHPWYVANELNWERWRLVATGGIDFVDRFLEKFSEREDDADFQRRKKITPTPNFAKAALIDVKNSIFQRMTDIIRKDGSNSYQRAVQGLDNGVDMHGASMNSFLGRFVLPELLAMQRVGVYVDMPELPGNTLLDTAGHRPYIYMYRTEEILSWTYRADRADEFASVLLRDWQDAFHPLTGLANGQWQRYRFVWIEPSDGKVHVRFYNGDANIVDKNGMAVEPEEGEFILDIDFIPFVMLELSDSLLSDVSNHQIALLNMESSDIAYTLTANFPFYIEQSDSRADSDYLKGGDATGTAAGSGANSQEVSVGSVHGRKFSTQVAPSFINPSSEPLVASMNKQKQLKDDIRSLISLAITNLSPVQQSAGSKMMDERGLEAGLSYIGLELEHAERKIALYWGAYERFNGDTLIKYPEKYSLQTDEDRRKDAEQLTAQRDSLPSATFQREMSKLIAYKLLGGKIAPAQLDLIGAEIDKAECFTAKQDVIQTLVVNGIMDKKLAALLLGIPESHVAAANAEQAQRLALISASQSKDTGITNPASRGVADGAPNPTQAAADEKALSRDNTQSGDLTPAVRGVGKGT